jgi:hypothetical protein
MSTWEELEAVLQQKKLVHVSSGREGAPPGRLSCRTCM